MPTLEEKMAEALSGKFFWDPTTDLDDCRIPEIIDIRNAQKEFSSPGYRKSNVRSRMGSSKDIDSKHDVMYLAESVAKAHNCDVNALLSKGHDKLLSAAKQHYAWSLLRYYPSISAFSLGKMINRDHGTIIHGARRFELAMDKYPNEIKLVDQDMLLK